MSERKGFRILQASLLALAALVIMAVPSFADLPCPVFDAPEVMPLSVADLVDVVVSTLLDKGIAVLLVGALAIVGLPWVVAGLAIALLYLPKRLRSKRDKALSF